MLRLLLLPLILSSQLDTPAPFGMVLRCVPGFCVRQPAPAVPPGLMFVAVGLVAVGCAGLRRVSYTPRAVQRATSEARPRSGG